MEFVTSLLGGLIAPTMSNFVLHTAVLVLVRYVVVLRSRVKSAEQANANDYETIPSLTYLIEEARICHFCDGSRLTRKGSRCRPCEGSGKVVWTVDPKKESPKEDKGLTLSQLSDLALIREGRMRPSDADWYDPKKEPAEAGRKVVESKTDPDLFQEAFGGNLAPGSLVWLDDGYASSAPSACIKIKNEDLPVTGWESPRIPATSGYVSDTGPVTPKRYEDVINAYASKINAYASKFKNPDWVDGKVDVPNENAWRPANLSFSKAPDDTTTVTSGAAGGFFASGDGMQWSASEWNEFEKHLGQARKPSTEPTWPMLGQFTKAVPLLALAAVITLSGCTSSAMARDRAERAAARNKRIAEVAQTEEGKKIALSNRETFLTIAFELGADDPGDVAPITSTVVAEGAGK